MLAEPGALALVERDDDVGGGLHARVQPRLREADGDRRPVVVALHRDEPTRCLQREVGGRPVRVRSTLPERADRGVDERGIERAQILVAEPDRAERARLERLHEHVGAARELAQPRAVGLVVEVEYDAALADGVDGPVQRAVELALAAVHERRMAPRGVATGRLDLDHLGAHVGEQPAGNLAVAGGEVEHANAREGLRLSVGRG